MNAAFVAAMEDVLELYSRPYDTEVPLACMDEQPIELHGDAYNIQAYRDVRNQPYKEGGP